MKLEQEVEQFLKEKYNMSDFNAYQRMAAKTAIYPDEHRIMYPALGLAGEAGEVANKVKKLIRDGPDGRPDDWREQISSEIGDVLWYCAALATDLNLTLGMIAAMNEKKLSARKEAGTIGGSGDTR
jgi:NTP pyrophosphatase (non-canonical NTP hydrolase)|tara:strand:- start:125 stop:502 length:378 start_codon:yes stop_codon:yes gene_type:complete